MTLEEMIKFLVENEPNNYELGNKVRNLYYEMLRDTEKMI